MKIFLFCLTTILIFCSTALPPVLTQPAKSVGGELKGYIETIPGSEVSFEMVQIPGGTFTMGSPAKEAGRKEDEGPQHQVRIAPFWMGKHEVTWDEYDRYAFGPKPPPKQPIDGPVVVTSPTPPYADESHGYGKGRQPAIAITWHAAVGYCRWLSEKTGKTYRLPTEAEWEYAARAGTSTPWSFGADPTQSGEFAWSTLNSDAKPHPVGKKRPNPWGLHDIHGNVAEWCIDQYSTTRYQTLDIKKIALGPVMIPGENRYSHVVRGGSWDDEVGRLRSAARRGSESDWSLRDPQDPQSIWWHTEATMVGFRIVRALEEQENLKDFRSKITRQSPNE
ncbi:MAG: formylglycine-generating enzyme family protein [Acidobacteria bacterium]|nr:formylglycine-generating enzyme family protein [Acidobacteriota bacterium]